MAATKKRSSRSRSSSSILRRSVLIGAVVGGVFALALAIALLIPHTERCSGFTSLASLQAYAATHPEFPLMDNNDLLKPDYTRYHLDQNEGFLKSQWRWCLETVGLATPASWTPAYAHATIAAAADELSKVVGAAGGDCAVAYTANPATRFIILGELAGAFHSCVRDLAHAVEIGALSSDLILPENTLLVCMGDAISRSPYGLEVATLLATLMLKNKERVIYLRGNHEDARYWYDKGMKEQIRLRTAPADAERLVATVDRLFATLPLGLYVQESSSEQSFIRFSHKGLAEEIRLREDALAEFLRAPRDTFAYTSAREGVYVPNQAAGSLPVVPGATPQPGNATTPPPTASITLSLLIRSETKSATFQTMAGLRSLPAEHGVPAWTLFSCPTLVVQKGLSFFHDAFAICTRSVTTKHWEMTLYNRDTRTSNPFAATKCDLNTGVSLT